MLNKKISNDSLYAIALTQIVGVGDVVAKNIVAYCGSAEAVFSSPKHHLEKIPGVGAFVAAKLKENKEALLRAEEELKFIEQQSVTPILYTDSDYPRRLKNCHDAPLVLYYKGSADLNTDKVISVVGTRYPSEYGKQQTEKLIGELQGIGCLIVSGLAYGIDITAHKAALDSGLETVGVLAHGLDKLYPSVHEKTAQRMTQQGGLITDYVSGTNPDRENFPKRNRIVAGLCDALIVVESKREGGSLITATIANSYNKDVFAFPGKAGEPLSEGCNGLIKTNKATLIESAADLLYMMQWDKVPSKTENAQKQLAMSLDKDEQQVIDTLNKNKQVHIDDLCYMLGLPTSKVSGVLLQLEFSNVVKALPGKIYALK